MCNMTLIWSLSHFTSMVKSSPDNVMILAVPENLSFFNP